jgi:hypothetical protein
MKENPDDATCQVCGGELPTPFEKQRGVHDHCREKPGSRHAEK